MEPIAVILVAGGFGTRFGSYRPKQFLLLAGRPVLAHTIDRFAEALPGAEIVVVLPEEHIAYWRNLAARFEVKPHRVAAGGACRTESVRLGLAALQSDPALIAVHDGVRPLASAELIRRVARAAAEHGAAIPVLTSDDSYRQTDAAGSHALDRASLRIVQTPQLFRAELLRRAYVTACTADSSTACTTDRSTACTTDRSTACTTAGSTASRPAFTDDASLVEAAGTPIHLCEGERTNLKITAPEDLAAAEAWLAARDSDANEAEPRPGHTPAADAPAAPPESAR